MTEAAEDVYNFCWWYAYAPECIAAREASEQVKQVDPADITAANVNFLMVSGIQLTAAILIQFIYRKYTWEGTTANTSYYSPWTTYSADAANVWQWASLMLNYGSMALFGTAFITQLIYSLSGGMADINKMIWEVGVFQGSLALFALYILMNGFAFDKVAYACQNGSDDNACTVKDIMSGEWMTFFGLTAFSIVTVAMDSHAWTFGINQAIA